MLKKQIGNTKSTTKFKRTYARVWNMNMLHEGILNANVHNENSQIVRIIKNMIQILSNRKKCSKCGSTNSHSFSRTSFELQGLAQIIKCLDCNHEKVESVFTTTSTQLTEFNFSQIIDTDKTF